jgi:hypothetical protein
VRAGKAAYAPFTEGIAVNRLSLLQAVSALQARPWISTRWSS